MDNIFDVVRAAIARSTRPGIEGWGMNNPDPNLFEERVTGEVVGCTSETCQCVSHDPAAPSITLYPKRGKVVMLGYDDAASYFAVVDGTTARFFRRVEEGAYHARLREVAAEQVPDWALLSLAQPA